MDIDAIGARVVATLNSIDEESTKLRYFMWITTGLLAYLVVREMQRGRR
jgi:hypothetical protein